MRPSRLGTVLAALLVAACAPAVQRTFVAPTPETVVSTTEERQNDPPEHLIYVENHSSVPVTVFSVSLRGCENLKQQCAARPVNIPVQPGARTLVLRVEPANRERGFGYHFGFSWHADSSSVQALSALAQTGHEGARAQLASMHRADSLRREETGVHHNELSRDDFAALAGRVAALRADPDTLRLVPGERSSVERIRLLLVDSAGIALGRTHWVRWSVPSMGAVQFVPPEQLVARAPGRLVMHFRLAEEAQTILGRELPDLDYPVIVAYPADPHAPRFQGVAHDAESGTPLACARVALEDSAQNVVARDRSGASGTFYLTAPRPGTYRVRFETSGWSPVYGAAESVAPDEVRQGVYAVRFVDQLLVSRAEAMAEDFQRATPAAVTVTPAGARRGAAMPVVQGVTIGGSASMPILGIVGRVPPGTTWAQFVVDSTGRADAATLQLPATLDRAAAASVRAMLPRVRFSPARDAGTPTCELVRMQVNFSPR